MFTEAAALCYARNVVVVVVDEASKRVRRANSIYV